MRLTAGRKCAEARSQESVPSDSTSLAACTQGKSPALMGAADRLVGESGRPGAPHPLGGIVRRTKGPLVVERRGGAPLRVLPGPRPFVHLSRTNLRDALAVRDLERPGGPRLSLKSGSVTRGSVRPIVRSIAR